MRIHKHVQQWIALGTLCLVAAIVGCGGTFGLFNPAFINTISGGVVPVTPGPTAAFVLVRGLNETNQNVDFIVTIEREELEIGDDGRFQVDESGNFVTRPERETVQLTTFPQGLANDLGVLFPCNESPITFVGLGENLLPTDPVIFVGGQGPGGVAGFGVTAPNLNPLSLAAGNFNCGDTIVFRAFTNPGVAGGIGVQAFLQEGSLQPSIFSGPNTFSNLQDFLNSQNNQSDP